MRRSAIVALTLFAVPVAAQDHPAVPEHADHAADMPAHAGHSDTIAPTAPTLLEGYGVGGFPITTQVPQAQAFFSNGMELGAAFAHSAAEAAMKQAVALDPACAMCKWGEALVAGPTINFGKDEEERKPLYVIAREAARQAKAAGTERERALTAALVERYKPGNTERRDRAYAKAIQAVQARWPQDNEVAVLTADAMMVAAFGDYSHPDRALLAHTMPLLESVLARDPNHTPAIHFYIHAAEALDEPSKAEPYADRLEALAPRASHLVHMPSHTWYWVGRYEDAARTNQRAVEIGKENAARLGLPGPDGVWGLPYHAHNVIYGLGGALMAGDAQLGLELARPLVERAAARDDDSPVAQLLAALGYEAIARFDPAGVAPLPEPKGAYLKAAWHYARGEAAVARGDAEAVEAERAAIPASVQPIVGVSFAPELMLGVMRGVLAGRLATLRGDDPAAAEAFRAAGELEESDSFNDFTDPPAFWYPVRRDLAAALLAAGDVAGARREAEASLKLRVKDPVAEALLARIASASN
jgi:tetratricopeptide (TPR) repeat protein